MKAVVTAPAQVQSRNPDQTNGKDGTKQISRGSETIKRTIRGVELVTK